MRNILGKLFLAPALLAAAAFATTTAKAEATLQVPFSFTVAGKKCPAGLYTVRRDSLRNLLTLQSKDTARTFSWLFHPGDPAPESSVVLRFDAIGETHALESVRYGDMTSPKLDKKLLQGEHRRVEVVQGQGQ